MMNRELIHDFFTKLDKLVKDEVYIILGGARKKYARHNDDISASHEIVSRQMVREHDFHLFNQAIRKTKALLNVSTDKNTRRDLPEHTHVIYISINPRSTFKAKFQTDMKFMEYYQNLIYSEKLQVREDAFMQIKRFNVHYFSELQKTASRKNWNILDLDTKNINILRDLIQAVTPKYLNFVTETRGGFHIIYDRRANEYLLGRERKLSVIREKFGLGQNNLDIFKDRLTPIWGTEQGGFLVKPYLDLDWVKW